MESRHRSPVVSVTMDQRSAQQETFSVQFHGLIYARLACEMLFLGRIQGSRQDGEIGYTKVTPISLVFSEHVLTQPTALGFITSGFIPVGQEKWWWGGCWI